MGTFPASGVPLCAQRSRKARSASPGSSRRTIGKLTVRSMVAGSRPTAAQCSRRMASRVDYLLERPVRVPRVRPAGDGSQCLLRAAAADEDRQVSLQRDRAQERVVEAVEAPGVVEALAVEEAAHQPDGLVEAVQALAHARPEVDPERRVLAGEPGAADPQGRPAARHVVEGRRELGGVARVPERVGADHQSHLHAPRAGRHGAHGQPALQDRLLPWPEDGVEVIPGPDGVPAGILGGEGGREEARPVAGLAPELGAEAHGRHRLRLPLEDEEVAPPAADGVERARAWVHRATPVGEAPAISARRLGRRSIVSRSKGAARSGIRWVNPRSR